MRHLLLWVTVGFPSLYHAGARLGMDRRASLVDGANLLCSKSSLLGVGRQVLGFGGGRLPLSMPLGLRFSAILWSFRPQPLAGYSLYDRANRLCHNLLPSGVAWWDMCKPPGDVILPREQSRATHPYWENPYTFSLGRLTWAVANMAGDTFLQARFVPERSRKQNLRLSGMGER